MAGWSTSVLRVLHCPHPQQHPASPTLRPLSMIPKLWALGIRSSNHLGACLNTRRQAPHPEALLSRVWMGKGWKSLYLTSIPGGSQCRGAQSTQTSELRPGSGKSEDRLPYQGSSRCASGDKATLCGGWLSLDRAGPQPPPPGIGGTGSPGLPSLVA